MRNHLILVAVVSRLHPVGLALAAPDAAGFAVAEIATEESGKSITRTDFERCTPTHLIRTRTKDGTSAWLADGPEEDRAKGHWRLRHPGWCKALINVSGSPPDLVYDPRLRGTHDVYLGLRSVDPSMSLGVKLSDEDEFDIITAPGPSRAKHFNFEFHWRTSTDLTGRQIVFRAVGRKVYLQHLRFVPHVTRKRKLRVATDHVTVCKTQGRHHAFPGLARLPNGDLGVVFRDGVAHVCPFGRIMFTRSSDNGRTWSKAVCIAETPSDERDPSIHTLPDGRVAVTLNTWNSWMKSGELRAKFAEQTARIERDGLRTYTGCKIVFSDDSGRTWGKPINIPPFTPHGFALGPDGHLYYPATRNIDGRRYVIIWRSEDGGLTWTEHADAGASLGASRHSNEEVYGEPHLTVMPNGRWLVAIRVNLDGHVRFASSNDGRRWGRAKKLSLRGYPQHLLPLKDERLLMAYGYRFKPPGIRACVSSDSGKTWDLSKEVVLRHDGSGWDLGYPVSIEFDDGRVLTVYYHMQDGGPCFIEGAFYRP